MRIGSLVKSKWQMGIVGVIIEQVVYQLDNHPHHCDYISWRVHWIGKNCVFENTLEDQEDLELL